MMFSTFIAQELTDERMPYENSLLDLPIVDLSKANSDSGYARGLKRAEAIIRQVLRDIESGNYKPPEINIRPIELLFNTDIYSLVEKGPNE